MKMKGFIMFLSALLVLSSLGIGGNYANASTDSPDSNKLSQKTIDLVDEFVSFEDNKFVIEDTEAVISKIGVEEFSKVKVEIDDKNRVLSEVTDEEFNDMSVLDNSIVFSDQKVDEYSISLLASGGKNGIQIHWWGYKLYLNDNLTTTTAQALAGGAGVSTIVGLWAPLISAPTAVVKALAGTVAIVFGGASAMFFRTNKGKGVYLRFTGILPANVIYTGMFAQ